MFDFNLIDSRTSLGESGFYLFKSDEIVFLDLANPTILFYSLKHNTLSKQKINLPKPLGNIYPKNDGNFYISCFNILW